MLGEHLLGGGGGGQVQIFDNLLLRSGSDLGFYAPGRVGFRLRGNCTRSGPTGFQVLPATVAQVRVGQLKNPSLSPSNMKDAQSLRLI